MTDEKSVDDQIYFLLSDLLWVFTLSCGLAGLLFGQTNSSKSFAMMAGIALALIFAYIYYKSDALTRRWMLLAGIAAAIAVVAAISQRGLLMLQPLITPSKGASDLSEFVTSSIGCSSIAIGLVVFVSSSVGAYLFAIRSWLGLFAVMYLVAWFLRVVVEVQRTQTGYF